MLMSGRPLDAFTLARTNSSPPALAEAFKVYCAVDASDSRMRRAIFSRMVEIFGSRRSQVRGQDHARHTRSAGRRFGAFRDALGRGR